VGDELLQAVPEETDYILCLGRLEIFQKGLDTLVDAVSRLAAERPVRLLMAGTGKDETALQSLVRERRLEEAVTFLGRVEGQQKVDCLRRSLFCVMPSRYEGWPIVAVEAAACAKPVVGAAVPGVTEAVLHERTGLLVQPEDPDDLAAGLARLLDDDALRRTLGRQAREWATEFTWDRIAERQEAVYDRVADREGSA
jgi:glycosyltransferase involved in cell wall biosynthesis